MPIKVGDYNRNKIFCFTVEIFEKTGYRRNKNIYTSSLIFKNIAA